jgi:cell division initiation protein
MIDLTPLEVRKKKGDFRRAMRGYEPALVDDFLDLVADRLDELVRENMALIERVTEQDRQVSEYRDRERALTEALVSAQEMRQQTSREAEQVRRAAEQEAEQLKARAAEEVAALRAAAEREAAERGVVAEQEAARLRAAAEQEAAQVRAAVDEEAARLRQAAQQEAAQREAGHRTARVDVAGPGDVRGEREREEDALQRLRARHEQFLGSYRAFLERELAELEGAAGLAADMGGILRGLGGAPPEAGGARASDTGVTAGGWDSHSTASVTPAPGVPSSGPTRGDESAPPPAAPKLDAPTSEASARHPSPEAEPGAASPAPAEAASQVPAQAPPARGVVAAEEPSAGPGLPAISMPELRLSEDPAPEAELFEVTPSGIPPSERALFDTPEPEEPAADGAAGAGPASAGVPEAAGTDEFEPLPDLDMELDDELLLPELELEPLEPFAPEPYEPLEAPEPGGDPGATGPAADADEGVQPDDAIHAFEASLPELEGDGFERDPIAEAVEEEIAGLSADVGPSVSPWGLFEESPAEPGLELYDGIAEDETDDGVPGPIGLAPLETEPSDWRSPPELGLGFQAVDAEMAPRPDSPAAPSPAGGGAAGQPPSAAGPGPDATAGPTGAAEGLETGGVVEGADHGEEETDRLLRNAAAAGYQVPADEELLLEDVLEDADGADDENGWLPNLLEDDR